MEGMSDDNGPEKENDDKYQNLAQQINFLQSEKKKSEEEFSMQRAKMKDLYLQKETEFKQQLVDQEEQTSVELKRLQTELDDCQSQVTVLTLELQSKLESETRKYREELSSLQHLLNETVEENFKYEKANKELKLAHAKLLNELTEMKASKEPVMNSGADIPQILSVPSTVISSLARKITTLSGSDNVPAASSSPILSQVLDTDTLDDSMRKAQEDAAVLRSLVVPLEEEIKVLKEKIREMDAELSQYKQNPSVDLDDTSSALLSGSIESNPVLLSSFVTTAENVSPSIVQKSLSTSCEMCSNYEAQMLNAQGKIHDLEKHIMSLERYKQELSKETTFRKEMEAKWNEKKEKYKEQVSSLQTKTMKAEETIKELRLIFNNTYDEVTRQLKQLCIDRENNQKELNRLQRENDSLVGKYSKHSLQLQNEVINLPDNVEDLQELILRCQEELISAKIAKEVADETVSALTEEMNILRDQSQSEEQSRIELENTLSESMKKLKNDVHQISRERNQHIEAFQDVDRDNVSLREELRKYNTKLEKLFKYKKHAEETINELRSRLSSLQTELDNSEKVQKDFVLLSQSLQQELEKIRGAETEVRWEHEEDVYDCRRCKNVFSVTRRKLHCKHCGRIFCSSCLTHTVHSGPNSRPSKVCDVCHTLLVRDSAPYFSTVPPQGNWRMHQPQMSTIITTNFGFILGKPFLVSSLVLVVYVKTIVSSTKAKGVSTFTDQFSRHHDDGDHKRRMMADVGSEEMRESEQKERERELEEKMMFQPAPCIWAVLACCAPTNFHFRFGCFPYLGCSTLFWQSDPCQYQIVMHAAEEAVQFYRQFDKRPAETYPTPPAASTAATTAHPQLGNSTTPTPTTNLVAEMGDPTTLSSDPPATTATVGASA